MSEPDFDKMSPSEIADYQRQNCIFCKIIKGDIPSRKVYEDDKALCIMDIYPAVKGHLLMLPKEHYPFLPLVPPDISAHLFRTTKAVSKAVKSALVTDRVSVFIANGGIAGQQSPHFIYHIIPREKGDGLENFNVPSKEIAAGESDRIAQLIRQKLSAAGKPQAQAQPAPKEGGIDDDFRKLAEMILAEPGMKDAIVKDPDGFAHEVQKHEELKMLFEGVDIRKLAQALAQIKG